MSQTTITPADPQTEAKWAGLTAVQTKEESYFGRKFMGSGRETLIEDRVELEKEAGDNIRFDLAMSLRQKPIIGDATAEGQGEELRFYQDQIYIEQMRAPVKVGGRMTRKRTQIDLRRTAKNLMSEHMAAMMDEIIFMYLSGAPGINPGNVFDEQFGMNPIQPPDAGHMVYPNGVVSKATMTAADTMSVELIERCQVKAKMMRQMDKNANNVFPVKVGKGKKVYCMLMSPLQAHGMRRSTATGDWMDIQKAAAGSEGRNSPLFSENLGMVKDVVLHEHERVGFFNDYGAGQDVTAARSLFMGRQAGVISFGTSKKQRFDWVEILSDGRQKLEIICGAIWGFKKTRFNDQDFGLLTVDTACPLAV